jgi:hypothetical protein
MNTDTIRLNRGINKDGAYWCQNIRPANEDGVLAGISMSNLATRTANTKTSELGQILNFTQIGGELNATIFGKDNAGDIYVMSYAGGAVTKAMDYSQTPGLSEGLMIDTNNNMVYTGSQYIGRAYKTTLDGNLSAGANTCALVDATDFPTAGYAVVITINSYEVIQWTGKSTNTLTGVTRGKYFSPDSAHTSGESVYYFKDQWLDLGASLTTSTRRCIKWEDRNFFVNGNKVSGYELSTATACVDYLTLSSDKEIVDLGILPTSATSYVLVGANSGENGYIYTWDGKDTATVSEKELKNNNITRMWENYVATDNGIYQYDGSNLNLIMSPIDDDGIISNSRFVVNDMKIVKNYLLYTATISNASSFNRNRAGFFYIDLITKDQYYVLPSNKGSFRTGCYGIFPSYVLIFVGTDYNSGSVDQIDQRPSTRGSVYQFIYKPTNARTLQLKNIRLNISVDPTEDFYNDDNLSFDVIIRGYDFTRQFIKYSRLKSGETPTGSSQLIIDDDNGVPLVGDRLEIISRTASTRVDSASDIRNITAVTSATGKHTIDVDEAFTTAIDATTQSGTGYILFNPLKKLGVGKISVTTPSLNLQGYDIPLREQPMFKKMLFEIEVRCGNNHIAPQLNSMEISYEILD